MNEIHEIEGYSHGVLAKEGFEERLVAICNGWIEAHNYIAKKGRPGMRIVGINNIHVDIKELREEEAEAR